jgi:hypothetical protein
MAGTGRRKGAPRMRFVSLEETELSGDLVEFVGDVLQFPYKLRLSGPPIGHPSSELLNP